MRGHIISEKLLSVDVYDVLGYFGTRRPSVMSSFLDVYEEYEDFLVISAILSVFENLSKMF